MLTITLEVDRCHFRIDYVVAMMYDLSQGVTLQVSEVEIH